MFGWTRICAPTLRAAAQCNTRAAGGNWKVRAMKDLDLKWWSIAQLREWVARRRLTPASIELHSIPSDPMSEAYIEWRRNFEEESFDYIQSGSAIVKRIMQGRIRIYGTEYADSCALNKTIVPIHGDEVDVILSALGNNLDGMPHPTLRISRGEVVQGVRDYRIFSNLTVLASDARKEWPSNRPGVWLCEAAGGGKRGRPDSGTAAALEERERRRLAGQSGDRLKARSLASWAAEESGYQIKERSLARRIRDLERAERAEADAADLSGTSPGASGSAQRQK